MPPTTAYNFGDVVLVPFPFTDQSATKRRPAVVVSSNRYHAQRPDVVLMAITSQVRTQPAFGETPITGWRRAGLIKPGVVKPILATIEKTIIAKRLGHLQSADLAALQQALKSILG